MRAVSVLSITSLPATLALVAFAWSSTASAQRLPAIESDKYDRCLESARKTPEAAWETALTWRSLGGGHPAEHCAAVALIGLKQYGEAATRLEKLADAMLRAPPDLVAGVLGQAGQAWLLAGNPARAHAVLTAALVRGPNDPDLLIDRAQASAGLGNFQGAVDDLTNALARDGKRVDALVFRASAYRALEKLPVALADVQNALKLAPNSADALLERGNILRLTGDVAGARRDWARTAMLAPNTPAETAARANIERLELGTEAAGTPPAKPAPPAPAPKKK